MKASAPPEVRRSGRPAPQPQAQRLGEDSLRPGDRRDDKPREPLELESVSSRWQVALDAAHRALDAAAESLPLAELAGRRNRLAEERAETAGALRHLAGVARVYPAPWLSPVPVSNDMLGLPGSVKACLFDLDGVLTDSGLLHSWAWGAVLDEFLLRLSEKADWHFVAFDREADYRAYLDGRPRLEGVHAFLASRGIRLPDGSVDDPPDAETAYALARRKGVVLARRLRQRGSTALPGARRYLQAAGHAGLGRCVLSASSSTSQMLRLAGLQALVDELVDADVIRVERLRSRPAPDLLLVGCRRLGVPPHEAATFTNSAVGVAAGQAAGMLVVGIGTEAQPGPLEDHRAGQIYLSLSGLLDRRLGDGATQPA